MRKSLFIASLIYFNVAVCLVASAQDRTSEVPGELPRSQAAYRLVGQALNVMPGRYRRLADGTRLSMQNIRLVSDPAAYFRSTCSQCSADDIEAIKQRWMCTLGSRTAPSLPIYIMVNSERFRSLALVDQTSRDQGNLESPAPEAIAAGLSHEMFHILNQSTDEVQAHTVEQDVFGSFMRGSKLSQWPQWAAGYHRMLEDIVNEERQRATTALVSPRP